MTINFDMDGTIADLYGVENWLDYLIAEDTFPYEMAKPLVRLCTLARLLNRLQREGNEIAVISWTSKNGSNEYNARVAQAKIEWLNKHLPSVHWNAINIVSYGTRKSSCGSGILFDDEEPNRIEWGENAFDEKSIFEILKNIR